MSYIGNTPTTQSFISGTDYFNGTGAQTAFTLSRTVASVNDIQAVVNNVVQVPNDAYTISGTTITFTSAPSSGTQNVYVRYLSTTTQAITPSQNTVSWSTLDTNTQQDLGINNKNRIINGNMTIDQRNAGASITPTDGQYVVDRFSCRLTQSSKYSAQQDAGAVTPPVGFTDYIGATSLSAYSVVSSDNFQFQHRVEGFNVADLAWGTANAKTITLSFWVRSSLTGTFGGSLLNASGNRSYPFTYTISAANTWEYETITITGDTSGTWNTTNGRGIEINFSLGAGTSQSGTAGVWSSSAFFSATGTVSVVGTNGATFYITGVMLEVGTQATTFTTAGGSYGAELALCQRYYAKVGPSVDGAFPGFGTAGGESSTAGFGIFNTPVTMRSVPTFSSSGTIALYGGGGFFNITSFGTAYYTRNTVAINMTASGGGITVGRFYSVLANGDTSAFVQFNSEL